ncbi:MAG: NADPH-dependent 7-cyano-7-deazaguanine reductase QueF [SAR86 cluster bacterium]|uniref:NADPH-dependent 7-cyano-7-deazaguanine reductase QueF n=1 Tax=SAR86 cluster bacterium TaxID=2030880 RepID=A0A2A5BB80_9GAMM|nr:MAG: NADPH-dependent 7-cyano-7-deazaguanine reductase QueF [SAR86 cluster bacterium]
MDKNPLGEDSPNPNKYSPDILYPIARWATRSLLDIDKKILMFGIDHWQAYEISWLDSNGKPRVGIGEFFFNSDSENIVESKSLKLYLNSLNQERFETSDKFKAVLEKDLSALSRSEVMIEIYGLDEVENYPRQHRAGKSIDELSIGEYSSSADAELLTTDELVVDDEQLYSDLFRSNCPVTGQPDWASIEIRYTGKKIDEASLLTYLISYRGHQGYHEECAERIFRDITVQCQPTELRVAMNFLRRGGLDINVYRSTVPVTSDSVNYRQIRQ